MWHFPESPTYRACYFGKVLCGHTHTTAPGLPLPTHPGGYRWRMSGSAGGPMEEAFSPWEAHMSCPSLSVDPGPVFLDGDAETIPGRPALPPPSTAPSQAPSWLWVLGGLLRPCSSPAGQWPFLQCFPCASLSRLPHLSRGQLYCPSWTIWRPCPYPCHWPVQSAVQPATQGPELRLTRAACRD